jgi:tripartite-type tricarboxylate transporter receptor subunit TctC
MATRILVGLVVLFIFGVPAVSSYPDHTITIVVPASPGGAMDFVGRLLAQHLPQKLNKPAVVENRPGGGTLIGSTAVAKARPDGHTLLVMPLGTLFNAILSKTSPISFDRDLVPISVLVDDLFILVVNAELPISTVTELIACARSRPNELSFGTAGGGSLPDIAAQLLMN